MPTAVRTVTDERDALLQFLAAQRAALRLAVSGLTDEQVAARPTVSDLCLGGLIKHAARGERGWVAVILAGRPDPEPSRGQDWAADFRLEQGETVAGWLETYQSVARQTEEIVRDLVDLEQTVELPEAPWFPGDRMRSARWILLHLIEETARHAGHADIIRESLDGVTAMKSLADVHRE